jgi:hypothetical protein
MLSEQFRATLRSCDMRDYVDYEADDCVSEEKRINRMDQGDTANSHRSDGGIQRLIRHDLPQNELRGRAS